MFSSVPQMLVALNVLAIVVTTTTTQVDALPITSKPIEHTVENLAWQAWIMMPPHQQDLEKSRKVTPKSIFVLPNRVQIPAPLGENGEPKPWLVGEAGSGSGLYAPIECPPGQRQFESRCISILDIDRDQLLIQELEVLLKQGNGSANNNNTNMSSYDYDYDYDEESTAPLVIDDHHPSSIAVANGNYDEGFGVAQHDSPLKFDIFKANFPTNTEAEHNPTQTEKPVANKAYAPQLLVELNQNSTEKIVIFEGQNMSARNAISNSGKTNNTTSSNETNLFSVSDIDAIIFPAASSLGQHTLLTKNDSIVQVVPNTVDRQVAIDPAPASAVNKTATDSNQVHVAVVELFKEDSVLSLHSGLETASRSTTVKSSTATPLQSSASKAATIEGIRTGIVKATPLPLIRTTFMPDISTAELNVLESNENKFTTVPKIVSAGIEEVNTNRSEEQERKEGATLNSTLDEMNTRVPETTLDPFLQTTVPPTTFLASSSLSDPTTSTLVSLDETTVFDREEQSTEEMALLENQQTILAAVQRPPELEMETQQTALNESTVEPVEHIPANPKRGNNDDDSQTTSISTLQDTTPYHNPTRFDHEHLGDEDIDYYRQDYEVDDVNHGWEDGTETVTAAATESTTPTPTTASTTTKITIESTTTASKTTTLKTTTTMASTMPPTTPNETDASAELRAINELVKNRRQAAEAIKKLRIPLTATTTASSTTTTKQPASPTAMVLTLEKIHENVYTRAKSQSAALNHRSTKKEATAIFRSNTSLKLSLEKTTTPGTDTTKLQEINLQTAANTTPSAISSTTTENNFRNRNITTIKLDQPKLGANSFSDIEKNSKVTTPESSSLVKASSSFIPTQVDRSKELTTSDDSSSPYWWLPIGWRLDPPMSSPSSMTSNNDLDDDDSAVAVEKQPLLLRFWAAFPRNQHKDQRETADRLNQQRTRTNGAVRAIKPTNPANNRHLIASPFKKSSGNANSCTQTSGNGLESNIIDV